MKRPWLFILLLLHPLALAAQQTGTVRVPAGEEARADFTLRPAVIQLDDLVVARADTLRWRGQQPTAGAAAHTDTFSTAARTSAETFSELLAGRVPGLLVQRFGGSAGAASRLELRGPHAVALNRQPLLVVDGVRAIGETQALVSNPGGGASISGYDDIDPEMVESVVVLPGPAAAARYGPGAANGAIEVRTRRGEPGRPRWRAFAEAGARDDPGGYPANFAQVGRTTAGARVVNCTLLAQSAGVCTPVADSLRSYNPLEQSSPFRTGSRLGAGVAVDGATEAASYAAGLGFRRTLGVLEENEDRLASGRASVALRPRRDVEVRVSAAHLRRDAEPPLEGPTVASVLLAGLLGTADPAENGGYHPLVPRELDLWDGEHQARRTLAGAEAAWSPLAWLTVAARYGMDRADRDEDTRTTSLSQPGDSRVGTVDRVRELRTTGADATVALTLADGLGARTTLGVERVSERASSLARQESFNGTFNETGYRARRAVAGVSLRQAFAAGPLALEAGVRRDEPRGLDELWSGSAGAAWMVGRAAPWLDQVRLRGAYGRSERSTEAVPGIDGPEALIITCPLLEPCEVEPQVSAEAEAGVDALLAGRVEVRLTGYVRDDSDVLLPEPGFVERWLPGTKVRNTGAELSLRAVVARRPGFAWDVELLGWANRNRVTERPRETAPVIGPNGGRIQQGRPLGAYFERPILRFSDRDGDGTIDAAGCPANPACEIELGDTAVYLGAPHPTRVVAFASRVRLGGRVALSARLEHQGGAKLLNRIEMVRCASFANCRAAVDRSAPLDEQARVAAAGLGSAAGFVEDAGFVKLREVAVVLSAPPAWSRRIGAAGVDLVVAGRNLATWTSYTGLDPETETFSASAFERTDVGAQPLPRTVTTRLELRF